MLQAPHLPPTHTHRSPVLAKHTPHHTPPPESANPPCMRSLCSSQQCTCWAQEEGANQALTQHSPRPLLPHRAEPAGLFLRSVAGDGREEGQSIEAPQIAHTTAPTRPSTPMRATQKAVFIGVAGQAPSLDGGTMGSTRGARVLLEASRIREVGTEQGREGRATGVPASSKGRSPPPTPRR